MPGRNTIEAIFITRELQEKFHTINKTLSIAFANLKRHSIVYPDVLSGGISACLAKTECVLVANRVKSSVWKLEFTEALAWAPYYSSLFWTPSPKSFVQDVPGKPVCSWPGDHLWVTGGISREADPLEALKLRVNVDKTRVLTYGLELDMLQKFDQDPYVMCLNGVGTNSVFCGDCSRWVLKRCSGIPAVCKQMFDLFYETRHLIFSWYINPLRAIFSQRT